MVRVSRPTALRTIGPVGVAVTSRSRPRRTALARNRPAVTSWTVMCSTATRQVLVPFSIGRKSANPAATARAETARAITISENAPTTNGLPSSDRWERASNTTLVGYKAIGKCTSIGCSGRPRPPWSRLGISPPGSTAWPGDATAGDLEAGGDGPGRDLEPGRGLGGHRGGAGGGEQPDLEPGAAVEHVEQTGVAGPAGRLADPGHGPVAGQPAQLELVSGGGHAPADLDQQVAVAAAPEGAGADQEAVAGLDPGHRGAEGGHGLGVGDDARARWGRGCRRPGGPGATPARLVTGRRGALGGCRGGRGGRLRSPRAGGRVGGGAGRAGRGPVGRRVVVADQEPGQAGHGDQQQPGHHEQRLGAATDDGGHATAPARAGPGGRRGAGRRYHGSGPGPGPGRGPGRGPGSGPGSGPGRASPPPVENGAPSGRVADRRMGVPRLSTAP